MDVKTARKYLELDKMPSELQAERIRTWRTRSDPSMAIYQYRPGEDLYIISSILRRNHS